jgi:hypothetical protein
VRAEGSTVDYQTTNSFCLQDPALIPVTASSPACAPQAVSATAFTSTNVGLFAERGVQGIADTDTCEREASALPTPMMFPRPKQLAEVASVSRGNNGRKGRQWMASHHVVAEWLYLQAFLRAAAQQLMNSFGNNWWPQNMLVPPSVASHNLDAPRTQLRHMRGALFRARDSLLLDAALVSFLIALYECRHPDDPYAWHKYLISPNKAEHRLKKFDVDRLRVSAIAEWS